MRAATTDQGDAPAVAQIAVAVDLSPSTVHYQLGELETKGAIARESAAREGLPRMTPSAATTSSSSPAAARRCTAGGPVRPSPAASSRRGRSARRPIRGPRHPRRRRERRDVDGLAGGPVSVCHPAPAARPGESWTSLRPS
ncbi:LexA family protein [Streptomyces sp. NPDC055752]